MSIFYNKHMILIKLNIIYYLYDHLHCVYLNTQQIFSTIKSTMDSK